VSLGQRLKRLRGKKSQDEFAKTIGISRSRYSHYELDTVEPDINTLKKIADIHNVSIDHLLGIETQQPGMIEEERAFYDALQEDPDDEFFVDGYLNATEEEKKMMRKFWRDHIWKKRK
jgi:transcriptional regulator with XRE-family HTH domain